jgi:hypothetical protein
MEEDPGVVDEGRLKGPPVLEGVSFEAVVREKEDGAGLGILVLGSGVFWAVDVRGTGVLVFAVEVLVDTGVLAGVLFVARGVLAVPALSAAVVVFSCATIDLAGAVALGCRLMA